MFKKFIYLDNEIEKYFSHCEDPFKKAKEIDGDVYRMTANRITKRFELNKKTYFLKYHGPIGYVEIFKNILKFQLPTVSAKAEWNALYTEAGCMEMNFVQKEICKTKVFQKTNWTESKYQLKGFFEKLDLN